MLYSTCVDCENKHSRNALCHSFSRRSRQKGQSVGICAIVKLCLDLCLLHFGVSSSYIRKEKDSWRT